MHHMWCSREIVIIPFLKQNSLHLTSSVENMQDSSSLLFQAFWPDSPWFLWLFSCQTHRGTGCSQAKLHFITSLILLLLLFVLLWLILEVFILIYLLQQQSQGPCTAAEQTSAESSTSLTIPQSLSLFTLSLLHSSWPLSAAGDCRNTEGDIFLINSPFDLQRKISPTALLHI